MAARKRAYDRQQKLIAAAESKGASAKNAEGRTLREMDRAVLVQKPCEYSVRFTFQSPETDHAAISALGAGFAYSDGQGKLQSKQIFSGLDFGIHRDSRVAVVGRNGSGKSTLLRLLSQQLLCTVSYLQQLRTSHHVS